MNILELQCAMASLYRGGGRLVGDIAKGPEGRCVNVETPKQASTVQRTVTGLFPPEQKGQTPFH